MAEVKVALICPKCGSREYKMEGVGFYCPTCRTRFAYKTVQYVNYMQAALNEREQTYIANARQNLYAEVNKPYQNSDEVKRWCSEIKKYIPDDFFANFYLAAGNSSSELNLFLKRNPVPPEYLTTVLDYLLTAIQDDKPWGRISDLIERNENCLTPTVAYRYRNDFGDLIDKLNSDIFIIDRPRDVFLAYSGADMEKVLEISEFLESKGHRVFASFKNLRQGAGAANRYDEALKVAIRHCKIFVFVSSEHSRVNDCIAMKYEIPYMVDNCPQMERIEYILEPYGENENNKSYLEQDVFLGRTWAKTVEDLNDKIASILRKINIRGTDTGNPPPKPDSTPKRDPTPVPNPTTDTTARKPKKKKIIFSIFAIIAVLVIAFAVFSVFNGRNTDDDTSTTDVAISEVTVTIDNQTSVYGDSLVELTYTVTGGTVQPGDDLGITLTKADGTDVGTYAVTGTCNSEKYNVTFIEGTYTITKRVATLSWSNTTFTYDGESHIPTASITNLVSGDSCTISVTGSQTNAGEYIAMANGLSNNSYQLPANATQSFIISKRSISVKIDNKSSKHGADLTDLTYTITDGTELTDHKAGITLNKASGTAVGIYTISGNFSNMNYDITFTNGTYTIVAEISSGLAFSLSEDQTYYTLTGIGTCTNPDIVIPSTYKNLPVRNIQKTAFQNCNNLTSIVVPDSISDIGEKAFSSCDSLNFVVIGDSVTSIGERAFSFCRQLNFVTIGAGVTSIGDYAFYNCYKLVEVYNKSSLPITKGSIKYGYVGCYAKDIYTSNYTSKVSIDKDGYIIYTDGEDKILMGYTGQETDLTLPAGITEINQYAFYQCDNLKSVVIPNGVTCIGEYAFGGCIGLTSLMIPDGASGIDKYAFRDCCGLNLVVIPDSVNDIGEYAFSGCSGLTSLIIPDGVKNIDSYAFNGCSGLTSIVIPKSVVSIGVCVFTDCNAITSIVVSNKNTIYHSQNNCIIEIESKTLIAGCKNSIIPTDGSVTSIEVAAFQCCSELTSITIPDSVTSIGMCAFMGCSGLTSIEIPDSVTSIGYNAFYNCSGLTSIVVSSGNGKYHSSGNCLIETASKTLILGCKTSIIPSDGTVTSIGNHAFSSCSGLTSIEIPDSVTSIGDYVFFDCSGLTSIEIPDSVTSIGFEAFSGCSKLTSVTFENTTGWYVSKDSSATIGTDVTITDPATNAKYLKSTYDDYYWKRK